MLVCHGSLIDLVLVMCSGRAADHEVEEEEDESNSQMNDQVISMFYFCLLWIVVSKNRCQKSYKCYLGCKNLELNCVVFFNSIALKLYVYLQQL